MKQSISVFKHFLFKGSLLKDSLFKRTLFFIAFLFFIAVMSLISLMVAADEKDLSSLAKVTLLEPTFPVIMPAPEGENTRGTSPVKTSNITPPLLQKPAPPAQPDFDDQPHIDQQASAMFGSMGYLTTASSSSVMAHHSVNMNRFKSGRLLAGVELQDVATGEMLAATVPAATSSRLKPGGLYSYGQIYGFKMNQNGINELAGFNSRGYGLETGIFRQLESDWSLGVMVGFQNMNTRFKGSTGSRSDHLGTKSLHVGPFAAWNHGNWHFNTAVTYGVSDINSSRKDSNDNKTYTADFKATEWTTLAYLGYDISLDHLAIGLILTPVVEMLYISSTVDGFQEKGAGKQALKVGHQNQTSWITRTGLQMTYVTPHSAHPVEFRAGIGVQRNSYSSVQIKAGYVQQGTMQKLKSSSYDDNSMYYNLGYSVALQNHQNLHFDYFGSSGSKSHSRALAMTYEMKF